MITSLHNPRIKRARQLRDRRQREEQQRFLIDGARELLRALQARIALEEVFVSESLCTSPASIQVLAQLPGLSCDVVPVAPDVFQKLAYGERAEGVLAVALTPQRSLGDLKLPADPLIAVLEGIEKPGNLGAALRSADGAGVSALIVANGKTDLFNPNTIRASLGTLFTLPVGLASSEETLRWLREKSVRIFTANVDAAQLYTQADYTSSAAIVLGNEAHGLTNTWSAPDCRPIKLPMQGTADSLNVSATAAVLFYEALRQRTQPS